MVCEQYDTVNAVRWSMVTFKINHRRSAQHAWDSKSKADSLCHADLVATANDGFRFDEFSGNLCRLVEVGVQPMSRAAVYVITNRPLGRAGYVKGTGGVVTLNDVPGVYGGHAVDTLDRTVEQTLDEIERRLADGSLRLDPARVEG